MLGEEGSYSLRFAKLFLARFWEEKAAMGRIQAVEENGSLGHMPVNLPFFLLRGSPHFHFIPKFSVTVRHSYARIGVLCLSLAAGPIGLAAAPKQLTESDWSSIRAAYEEGRHAFQWVEGAWRARNPGQRWTTKFDGKGFLAEPKDSAWSWGLELRSYGFAGQEKRLERPAVVSAQEQRLAWAWDACLEEWLVNDQRGLEHGFTLRTRPSGAGASPLSFTLGTRGSLLPKIAADAQGVLFQDANGSTVLHYLGLKVWDAEGRPLAARFEPAEENGLRLLVEERDARYPITIDPVAQQAYLKPAAVGVNQTGDEFGTSVAISGDTVVVGAPKEDSDMLGVNNPINEGSVDSGAAYVFKLGSGGWSQQAILKPSDVGFSQAGDQFGFAVAISGDTLVVGAPKEDSDTTGSSSSPNDTNGSSFNAGAAYVFTRGSGGWGQQAYLKPSAVGTSQSGDEFGSSVAISGDTIVVGAPFENSGTLMGGTVPDESSGDAGAAYVFARSGGSWTQQAYLKPPAVGTSQAGDEFGISVAVSGDTVVVGAHQEDSSTLLGVTTPNDSVSNSGAAYVYTRAAGVWTSQAYLKPKAVGTTQLGDKFGGSVAISGDSVVVGASFEDSTTTGVNTTPNENVSSAGAAYVFERVDGAWDQEAYLKPSNVGSTQGGDQFGSSVAISENLLVVGASFEDSNTLLGASPDESGNSVGAAYVFSRELSGWVQRAYLKPIAVGTTQNFDNFGAAVGISGDTVVIGAKGEDGAGTGVGAAIDEGANLAGAAYLFNGLLTRLQAWRFEHFGTTLNVGNAANDIDFEGDGWKNLVEYGTVTNPKAFGETGITLGLGAYSGSQYLRGVFTRDPARNDVTIRVEASASLLGPWTTVASSVNGAATTGAGLVNEADLSGGMKQVEVRDSVPSTAAARRFLRIVVE